MGRLVSTKGITLKSRSPCGVMKAVFSLELGWMQFAKTQSQGQWIRSRLTVQDGPDAQYEGEGSCLLS